MNAQTSIEAAIVPAVYAKIAAVQAELAREGISKDRSNTQQKYNFRGIDDVYNALAPILAKEGLCVLPRMLSRHVVERKSSSGNALFYVTVEAEFDFVAAEDASRHVVRTFGEAMDSGDKATNKAMSAAYKYAAFMAFAIPTEGDNDADAVTHTVTGNDVMPEAEFSRLVQLQQSSGVATTRLCKEYGVQSLRDLDHGQYANAIERLTKVLADRAKEETNRAGRTEGRPSTETRTNAQPSGEFADLADDDIPF